jgi:hypothetical protein
MKPQHGMPRMSEVLLNARTGFSYAAAVFFFGVVVSACGSSTAAAGFACGTLMCTSGSQYCLKVDSTSAYSCVDLPTGCTVDTACSTCLAKIASSEACVEIGEDIEVDTMN